MWRGAAFHFLPVFSKKKILWKLWLWFSKMFHQRVFSDWLWRISKFPFWRQILDIYRQPLLRATFCKYDGQEPITWILHLPYKPLESTLSDEKLFIEITFVEYFSRLLSNIQSEKSYDHTSHAESQKCDLNCCQQWRYQRGRVLIFYRVKNIRSKPNNKRKRWYTHATSSSLLVILTVGCIS